MLKNIVIGTVIALAIVVLLGWWVYKSDMDRAYDRIRGQSTVISSPYGEMEYSEGGRGPAVLVIHGGGGGYDQGELLVEAVLGDDFHWIAPSRFGYLGSSLPADATWDDQAHAYAHLLDQLGLDRVAVVALSQGGPSALLLAVLHPDRVSSLTCVSCGVARSASADQTEANEKGDMLRTVFTYDALYWAASSVFKKQIMGLMGANDTVVANLSSRQREMVERIIDYMNPAVPRRDGVILDNVATLPGERIAAITAPTLIVHARDDLLQVYTNAEFAVATIPGAGLLSFEHGGHVVVATEQEAIRTAVQEHILAHAGDELQRAP